MSTIRAEIQSLSPSAIIELYILDLTPIPGASGALYFHGGTNNLGQNIVWNGQEYAAYAIEASGFEWNSKGQAPRPTVSVGVLDNPATNLIGNLNVQYDDLIGARFVRVRTFAKYLDAINFTGGVNPLGTPDPLAEFPRDIYFVERKTSESLMGCTYELVSAMDLDGFKLPGRLMLRDICPWRYRVWDGNAFDYSQVAECTYAGTGYFDVFDQATTQDKDVCGKRLASCRARFGSEDAPYGGFPGAGRLR